MAQLEGSGRGGLASYNAEGYKALEDAIGHLGKMSPRDWIAKLMERNKMIGIVAAEVCVECPRSICVFTRPWCCAVSPK